MDISKVNFSNTGTKTVSECENIKLPPLIFIIYIATNRANSTISVFLKLLTVYFLIFF